MEQENKRMNSKNLINNIKGRQKSSQNNNDLNNSSIEKYQSNESETYAQKILNQNKRIQEMRSDWQTDLEKVKQGNYLN